MTTEPASGTPKGSRYLQVARNIRNAIDAGILKDGQLMPSSRELAKEWKTSTFTINSAMDLLTEEGLIVNKPRVGRFVNAPDRKRQQSIPVDRPRITLIGGYAGSGKTEFGRMLSRATGWPILDKDTLTRPVVETALEALGVSPHDRESRAYLEKIRPREYESLMSAADENADCGNSVIVTAPFLREFHSIAWLNRVEANYATLKASLTLAWVYCDRETMHTYIRQRGAARDSAKLADWTKYLGGIDLSFRPPKPHVLIDNSESNPRTLQDQAQDLIKSILQEG